MDPRNGIAQLAQLALPLHAQPELDKTIDLLLLCVQQAVDCSHASVWLCKNGEPVPAAASDPTMTQVDRVQLDLAEGPTLTAVEKSDVVVVPDTTSNPWWPDWSATAAGLGVGAVLSLPLTTRGTALGALNLANRTPYGFQRTDVTTAELIARHASTALSVRERVTGLWRELDEREVTGQAQGLLMERYQLDPDQSLDVLALLGRNHELDLRASSGGVLTGRLDKVALQQAVAQATGNDPGQAG